MTDFCRSEKRVEKYSSARKLVSVTTSAY
jgi:hypothetical protein